MKALKLSNTHDAVEWQKIVLSLFGFWPKRNPSFKYRLKYFLFWFFDLSFAFFLFWELWMNIKNGEFKEMISMISIMSPIIAYYIKHLIFDLRKNHFLLIIEKLKQHLFNEHPQVCDIYVQRVIRLIRIFWCIYVSTGMIILCLFGLKPFLSETEITAFRFTGFELGNLRWAFHVYQVFAFLSVVINCTLVDAVAFAFISIGSAEFEILRDKLINARKWAGLTNGEIDDGIVNPDIDFDPELDARINKHLAECVKHHMGILEFVSFVENVYTFYFLVQFFISVLGICNTWFQFAFETNWNTLFILFFYAIEMMMQLGMYCAVGNTIKLKSEELHYACYASDWYKSGNKVRKTLILIVERTKRPAVLTAGKISPLTLETYMGLLKMSYTYMAIMNNVYGK